MLSITYENKHSIRIVRISGDLTSDNIRSIRNDFVIEDNNDHHYIFDLQDLVQIDSTGLSYIINCLKKVMKNNLELKLLNLRNQPRIIFEITRVDSLFELYENEKEALKSFIQKERYNESNNTTVGQSA